MNPLKCKTLMEANNARVDFGGTGFSVNQNIVLNITDDDTIIPVQFRVIEVDENGAIISLVITNKGEYETITSDPYTASSGLDGAENALITIDWKIKSITIVDSYYMFPNPYITSEHNTNGEVIPIVDRCGYLCGVSLTNAGFGFTEQPVFKINCITEAQMYYKVWQGEIIDENRMKSMTDTISHFESLGYNIQRRVNSETGNTFEWVVSWNS